TAKNTAAAAETKLKAAQQVAAQAQTAFDKDKENQPLAAALETAKKSAAAALDEQNKAAAALAGAEKTFADTSTKMKETAQAKVEAEQAADAADAKVKSAEQARQTATQAANAARNKANPRNINVGYPSTPVTIKITPAPVTIAIGTAPPIKQGGKLEVLITINRLYAFTEQVQFNAQAPGGVGGLNIPQLTIAPNQNQGNLIVSAAATATPGRHELTLRADLRFNNQNVQVTETWPLTVELVEAAKK
ncbi:MAG TPA: hypothetical protein VF278_05815, partial [Pirellulales bacterium]